MINGKRNNKLLRRILKTIIISMIIVFISVMIVFILDIIKYFCPVLLWIIVIVTLLLGSYFLADKF